MIDFLILIFTFLPSIFVHLIILLGIAGLIVSLYASIIPFFNIQKATLKYASIIVIALGLFLEGGLMINNEYLQKEKDWKQKIELVESKFNEVNSKIEAGYYNKVEVVKDTQVVIQEKIKTVSLNIDKECKINKDIIEILNIAAKNGDKRK